MKSLMIRTLVKMFALIALIGALASSLKLWYQIFVIGQYAASADAFLGTLMFLSPLLMIGIAVYAAAKIVTWGGVLGDHTKIPLALLGILALAQNGCDVASANVQTLISDDCGVTWKLIKPGQTIPARVGVCAYKVSIPDYPMQGDTKFKTSFNNRVLADVEISYEYIIVDGVMFIGEAKYLGKKNSDTDDATNAAKKYESAENAVIDKRIREAATEMLIKEDIVEFSQADFEDKLLTAVNDKLKNKGVQLNFISFVPIPEAQTRLAIDMMTAMKIYESKGLDDLGKAVAAAHAGATQLHLETCTCAAANAANAAKDKD